MVFLFVYVIFFLCLVAEKTEGKKEKEKKENLNFFYWFATKEEKVLNSTKNKCRISFPLGGTFVLLAPKQKENYPTFFHLPIGLLAYSLGFDVQ